MAVSIEKQMCYLQWAIAVFEVTHKDTNPNNENFLEIDILFIVFVVFS